MKIKAIINGKEVILELQAMNSLDCYDVTSGFRMGKIKFSQYAQAVIKECIALPLEARELKFFENDIPTLDELVYQCSELSIAGLSKKNSIEVIED